jgi:nitroreductase
MIENLFNSRHTCRTYTDTLVCEEHMNLIIESAKKAPSKNCIFPYRIAAYTQSNEGKAAKEHLYRNVCTTIWNIKKDDMPSYDFDRTSIQTPNIKMVQCLRQIKSPLTLQFIGKFVDDYNSKNLYFDNANNFPSYTISEAMKNGNLETIARVIRDVTIACSWAQLAAQELGYDTSFVGIAGQHDNALVNQSPYINIEDNETAILMLCIGKKDIDDAANTARCQLEELNIIDNTVTEAVFYERTRPGEKHFRGNIVPHVSYI